MTAHAPSSVRHLLAAGALAGFLGGELFFVAGLVRTLRDFWTFTPTSALAAAITGRSAGLYGLLFALLGVVLAALLALPPLRAHRRGWPVFALVAGAMTALAVFSYLTVWWQIDVLGGVPIGAGERRTAALWHLLAAVAGGGVVAGALVLARRRWAVRRTVRTGRWALAALLFGVVLLVGGEVGVSRATPSTPLATSTAAPARVVVVGLDGLTFRVLSPLLRRGEAPTFQRLIDEGAWGTLLTYGAASSPQVWTSMATGKRVRDHGIDDFVRPGAGYRARPLKSYDRTSRAIWGILSDFDRRVAVVDWLITFPPEEVAGYMVTRLKVREADRTFPPALDRELRRLLRDEKPPGSPAGQRRKARLRWEIDRPFAVAEHLLAKEPLDFLALYDATADQVQHRHWKSYDPEAFDRELWRVRAPKTPIETSAETPSEPPAPALVTLVYQHLDRRLGALLAELPDDALLIVVSDHGQRAAAQPRVRLHLDRLLDELGWARVRRRPPRQTVYPRSRAYTLVETPWTPELRVNLNVKGREPSGVVERREATALAAQLAAELRALRFADGAPLFARVTESFDRGDGDLRVALSRAAHRPPGERTLVVGERRLPYARLVEVDTSISGDHDRQGVVFVRGPGVRPGLIGQRATTTAIQEIVWHLTDKVDAVDRLLPLLRRLGLIERATTLDLTPTVLHVLGLPVARDMAGRPWTELFPALPAVEWIDSYEGLGPAGPGTEPGEADEEVLEQLRSLGYVH